MDLESLTLPNPWSAGRITGIKHVSGDYMDYPRHPFRNRN